MTLKIIDKNSNEPPDELDGANVIAWAWSGDKPFGFMPYTDSSDRIEIFGLAICKYENSDVVYRFSCDKDWDVQNDSPHDSVEQAQRQLPDQYKLVKAEWVTKEDF